MLPEPLEELRSGAPPEPEPTRARSETIVLGPGRCVQLRAPSPEHLRTSRALAVSMHLEIPAEDLPVAAAAARWGDRAIGPVEALGRIADLPAADRSTLRAALARISA